MDEAWGEVWALLLIPTWGGHRAPANVTAVSMCKSQGAVLLLWNFLPHSLSPSLQNWGQKETVLEYLLHKWIFYKRKIMASPSSGAATVGKCSQQQQHRECTLEPGSCCVLCSGTQTAPQAMAPCKQGLERRNRLLSDLSSNPFWWVLWLSRKYFRRTKGNRKMYRTLSAWELERKLR